MELLKTFVFGRGWGSRKPVSRKESYGFVIESMKLLNIYS